MGACHKKCYSSYCGRTFLFDSASVGEISDKTILINDDDELNPTGKTPISEIKGWFQKNSFIEGLKISYGGKTKDTHISDESDNPNRGKASILLQYGEYITHITGKKLRNQIYELMFHTNQDRHCQIGTGNEGIPFELKHSKKCVSRIKFGYIQDEGICYFSVRFLDPRKLNAF